MYLNAFRIRMGLIIAGVLTMGIYVLAGGSLTPGAKPVIQIEFGIEPDEFIGSTVLIDGEAAGELKPFGRSWRTGFRVEEGKHTVEVVHPRYRCIPTRVTSGYGGRNVLLVLDFHSEYDSETQTSETVIGFQM